MTGSESQMTPSNIPIPDPSVITQQIIDKAEAKLREEIKGRVDNAAEVLRTRLDGMDKATAVLAENINRVPTLLDREALRLETLFREKINSLTILTEDRFKSVGLQFDERDIRATATEQAAKEAQAALSTASTTAVNAALQAQKESAFATQQFVAESGRKSESGFASEINSLKTLIASNKETTSTQIADLRSRLDRGEAATSGSREQRTDTHSSITAILGVIGGVVGVLSLFAVLIFGVINLKSSSGPPPTVISPAVVPVAPAR